MEAIQVDKIQWDIQIELLIHLIPVHERLLAILHHVVVIQQEIIRMLHEAVAHLILAGVQGVRIQVEVVLLVAEEALVVPVALVVVEDNNCDVYKYNIFKRSNI